MTSETIMKIRHRRLSYFRRVVRMGPSRNLISYIATRSGKGHTTTQLTEEEVVGRRQGRL